MPKPARTTRNPYRPTTRGGAVRNPFRNSGRMMLLIVLPPVAALAALIATWFGPDQAAIFGWAPAHGAASTAHWCAEVGMVQATPELQAHADYILTTPEYADYCG